MAKEEKGVVETHSEKQDVQDGEEVSKDWRYRGWESSVARFGPFVLLGIGLFLPWISVSAPIVGTRSLNGIDIKIGLLLLLLGVVILLVSRFKDEYDRRVRLYGGIAITGLGGLSYLYVQDQIDAMYADLAGNPFASAVSADVGIGLYLATLSGVLLAYVAYKNKEA